MPIPLEGWKVDYSVYRPNSNWDGCCWLDRDGTIVAVRGYACHYDVIDRVALDNNESSYEMFAAGYMHVSDALMSAFAPTEKQIDVLFHLANFSELVRAGVARGVRYKYGSVRWTL